MNRPLHISRLGLTEAHIQTINELSNILGIANELIICRGCEVTSATETTSVSFKDSERTLRHNKCHLKLESGEQCVSCKYLEKAMDKKERKIFLKKNCENTTYTILTFLTLISEFFRIFLMPTSDEENQKSFSEMSS